MKFAKPVIAVVALVTMATQEPVTASPKPCLAFASAPLKIQCVATSLDGSDALCSASFMINDTCGGPSLDDAFLDFKLADPETGQSYASVWTKPVDQLDDWSRPPRFQVSSVPTKIIARIAKNVEDKEKPGYSKLHIFSEDSIIYRGKVADLTGRWVLSAEGIPGSLKLDLTPLYGERREKPYLALSETGGKTVAWGSVVDHGEYIELGLTGNGGTVGTFFPELFFLADGMELNAYSMSKKHIQRMEGDCYARELHHCVMKRFHE